MGGGASVPEDMKQKIHTAFGLSSDADWATATDLKTEKELRDELSRLRNATSGSAEKKTYVKKKIPPK